MKKIKLLLTIPTITLVAPTTLFLAQCGNNDPIIDSKQADKVNLTTTKAADGSTVCTLTLTETFKKQKIGTIEVKIGDKVLTAETDYKTTFDSSKNATIITIFKSTTDKYSGRIVINPTVVDKEFNGIIAECTSKFVVGGTLTKDNVFVYQSLEGEKGSQIHWNNEKLKIAYNGTDITTAFKESGFKFATFGTFVFTISFDTFTTTLNIEVPKRSHVIELKYKDVNQCVTLPGAIKVEEDKTWGEVQPEVTPKSYVDLNVISYHWEYENGQTIPDTKLMTEDFTAYWALDPLPSTCTKVSKTCNTLNTQIEPYNVYIPSECNPIKKGNTISINADKEYTFTIDTTSKKIRYFWVTTLSGLLPIYNNNIISIKIDETELQQETDYSIYSWDQGSYIQFNKVYNTGTLTVKYRILKGLVVPTEVIPAYEINE